jgi:hypothetical protein
VGQNYPAENAACRNFWLVTGHVQLHWKVQFGTEVTGHTQCQIEYHSAVLVVKVVTITLSLKMIAGVRFGLRYDIYDSYYTHSSHCLVLLNLIDMECRNTRVQMPFLPQDSPDEALYIPERDSVNSVCEGSYHPSKLV